MVSMNLGFGREGATAVVDASPGGASVAIISNTRDEPSTLLASSASALSLEKRTIAQSTAQIAGHVKEASDRAMKLYAAAGRSTPITSAYIVLHVPWVTSQVVRASAHYDSPTRITDRHISALAKEALSSAADIDMARLFEASVVKIEVNGYTTPDPDGAMGSTAAVVSLVSDADVAVRSSIENAVHAAFPVAKVSWRTSLRTLMTVASATHLKRDFLAIDMGAEDTHISSMRDGVLEQLIVPEGTRTILARIAGNRSPDELLGYVRMIARDACSSQACEEVKQSLASVEPELVRVFGESIAKIANVARVPNDLILSAHPDLEDWLTAFFTRIDFAQFTRTSLPLSVYGPSALDLGQWVAGVHSHDPLTLAAALVNIEARS